MCSQFGTGGLNNLINIWHIIDLFAILLQVLTRRDQLQLKQKQEQKAEEASGDLAEPSETVEDPQPKKKGRKPVSKDKEPKAKAKAAGKARAKGKAKAKAKAEQTQSEVLEQNDENEVSAPNDKLIEEEVEESGLATPDVKKRLFHDQDEAADANDKGTPAAASPPTFLDPKTGKSFTLKEIYDNYVPNTWAKGKPAKKPKGNEEPEPSEPSKPASKAKAKAKAKGKAKAKAQAKCGEKSPKKVMSPSIKKEQQRRKRKQAEVMETTGADMTDVELKTKMNQMVSTTFDQSLDDMRNFLKGENGPGVGNHLCNFSSYWKKKDVGSVGVMKKDGGTWTYFAFKYDVQWNVNMTLAYCCAASLVTCPKHR